MADWSDFKPDTESGSGWEGFAPDPAPTLMQRIKKGAGEAIQGVRAGLDVATGLPDPNLLLGKPVDMKTSPDPMALMARHPYITAAATGAAMGPTMGIGALANVPGGAAAAGAAEQMAYQGVSDVGQKIAGPEHPVLGAIPGIVAPMLSPVATALGGGRVAAKAATAAEIQRAADEQAQTMAEQKLAMSAPDAAALARPTGINPQDAGNLSQAKNAVWQARRDALKTVGRQYDPIFQKVDEMPLTAEHTTNISEGVEKARQAVAARGRSLSPATEKVLDKIAPERTKASDASTQKLMDKLREQNPGVNPTTKKGKPLLAIEPEQQTIGQLRGHLAQLRQAADSPSISAVERSAIFDASKPIIQVLDSVIPDEQKPILASINAQYAQVNKILPFKGMKAMNSAGTLPELGEAMFSKPNSAATSMALAGMNDAQKGLMRDAFASWALNQKGSGKDLFNLLSSQRDNIGKLGFPPELSSVGQWNDLVTGANRMKTLPGMPAQKDFIKGVQDQLKQSGYSQQAMDAADDALRKSAQGSPNLIGRRLTYLAMAGGMGYGVLSRQPELWAPIATLGAAYMGKRAIINNPNLLPMYRNFVMGGWTRQGGSAFGKMIVGMTRDGIQAAAAPTLRPDKEREAEAATP